MFGNARAKRIRRGFEKNWNKFGEPLKNLLSPDNLKVMDTWLNRKSTRAERKYHSVNQD